MDGGECTVVDFGGSDLGKNSGRIQARVISNLVTLPFFHGDILCSKVTRFQKELQVEAPQENLGPNFIGIQYKII